MKSHNCRTVLKILCHISFGRAFQFMPSIFSPVSIFCEISATLALCPLTRSFCSMFFPPLCSVSSPSFCLASSSLLSAMFSPSHCSIRSPSFSSMFYPPFCSMSSPSFCSLFPPPFCLISSPSLCRYLSMSLALSFSWSMILKSYEAFLCKLKSSYYHLSLYFAEDI